MVTPNDLSSLTADQVYKNLAGFNAANPTKAIALPQTAAPATPAPAAPVAAPAPAAPAGPTIKDLYGSVSPSDQNIDSSVNYYQGQAQAPIDEEGIRNQTMSRLQSEIDATNQVYNQKLKEAHVAGENLLGQNAAISARRGLIGSDFGSSLDSNARSKNQDVYSAVDAERNAAIAGITSKGQTAANQEIANKRAAAQNDAQDYISFLSEQDKRRTQRTSDAASHIVGTGFDLSTATPNELKQIATSYGISPDALMSSYIGAKNTAAENAAKIAQDKANVQKTQADLTKPTGVSVADNAYQFDPTTGEYKQTAQGTASDSAIKEYQYAVQNDGYTGSLADWNAQKANAKVSIAGSRDPITGALQTYQRSGPGVAGTALPKGTSSGGGSVSLPKGSGSGSSASTSSSTPSGPFGLDLNNKIDTSTLQYIQTGQITGKDRTYAQTKQQIIARANEVIPGFNPSVAAGNAKEIGKQITYVADTTRAIKTADANFNLMLNTLKGKVNDSESPLVNQLNNLAAQKYLGSADVATFQSAVTGLQTEYSQVLGRGGTVDNQTRDAASRLLNGNYSLTDLQAVKNYIEKEGQNVIDQGNNEIKRLSTYGGSDSSSTQSTSALPQQAQDIIAANHTLVGNTFYIPQSAWAQLKGLNAQDQVIAEAKQEGYNVLIK